MATSPAVQSFEFGSSSLQEAQALLKLLRTGETIAGLRQLIGFSQERRGILLKFDALCIKRGQPATITDELRAEILRLLKLNWSQEKVAKALHVGDTIVRRCAKPMRASTWKVGRGRRFTLQTIEAIKQAIVTEKTSRKVERVFHIDGHTVQKLRREMGDFENRRHRKKLSVEQLEQAALEVASGRRWRDVARDFGVAPTTLLSNIKYRKRAAYHQYSDEERKEILTAVRRGEGKRSISRRLGRPRSSIYLLISRTAQARRR